MTNCTEHSWPIWLKSDLYLVNTHSHRGSENFPLLIMFKWTLYELCSLHIASWFRPHYWSCSVLIILTNQIVTFMRLEVLRKFWHFNLFIWVDYMPEVKRKVATKRLSSSSKILHCVLKIHCLLGDWFLTTVRSLWQPPTDVFLECRFLNSDLGPLSLQPSVLDFSLLAYLRFELVTQRPTSCWMWE